ncbi:hypothetical protein KEM54_003443 [Ascosphaera aggregata]|nr:hypothetical protein KEM54_003443 [Ascosphaera aggregata]
MRASLRLLASVKPASKYLKPFAPTGLAGLCTHPCPRPALLHAYKTTLEKLKAFPDSSVYRQAVEAVTKHRLAIIEKIKPDGFEEWQKNIKEAIAKDEARRMYLGVDGTYVVPMKEQVQPEDLDLYGDQAKWQDEGPAADEEEAKQREAWFLAISKAQSDSSVERLQQEPPLTAKQ